METKGTSRKKGKKGRKYGREYRALRQERFITLSKVTRYRSRHGIPAGSRKDNHRLGLCPVHKRSIA